MSQTDIAGCPDAEFAPDTPWFSGRFRQKTPPCRLFGVGPQPCLAYSYPQHSLLVNLIQLGHRASHNQNWLYFSQSPKGFLESYEEMLSYALRPETWATTRLELEGRGVSLFVLSSWASSGLRSFCWELVPSSVSVLSS